MDAFGGNNGALACFWSLIEVNAEKMKQKNIFNYTPSMQEAMNGETLEKWFSVCVFKVNGASHQQNAADIAIVYI